MDKQLIQDVVNTISPELTWLFIQGFMALFIFSFMRNLSTAVANYLKLRFSLWGLNTKLNIEGKIGYIRDITFKEVIIHVSNKETMYIPIDRFLILTKTVYHNGYTGEDK